MLYSGLGKAHGHTTATHSQILKHGIRFEALIEILFCIGLYVIVGCYFEETCEGSSFASIFMAGDIKIPIYHADYSQTNEFEFLYYA